MFTSTFFSLRVLLKAAFALALGLAAVAATPRQTKARSIKAYLILALLVVLSSLVAAAPPSATAAGGKLVAPPAISAPTPDPAADRGTSDIDPDAAAAVASQKGISIA